MTNVCLMSVLVYVVCAGRTEKQVTANINHFVYLNRLTIHPPPRRCPPL